MFSEICNGHLACPHCKRTNGPIDPGDGLGCCGADGFWDEIGSLSQSADAKWLWFHANDECKGADDYKEEA